MTYKEFKNKYPDKKERRSLFFSWLKMRIHELRWDFKYSPFVNHISFLWHWKNFFFCLKYPFWKPRNAWDGRFMGYSYTFYDSIPYGWRLAFGKQLSKDIKKAGKETRKRAHKHISWKELISFHEIKEKWGELCLYASASQEIQDILEKYETMSSGYCITCGKPARYVTKGYILFFCEDCYVEHLKQYKYSNEEIEKCKLEDRLTKKDIPESIRVEHKTIKVEKFDSEEECQKRLDELRGANNTHHFYIKEVEKDGSWVVRHVQSIEHVIDYKKEYGIDFEELWGLN